MCTKKQTDNKNGKQTFRQIVDEQRNYDFKITEAVKSYKILN